MQRVMVSAGKLGKQAADASKHCGTVQTPSKVTVHDALQLSAVPPLAARVARLLCHAGTAKRLQQDAAIVEWQATLEAATGGLTAPFERPGVLELTHPAGEIRAIFDLTVYPVLDFVTLPDGFCAPVPDDTACALRIATAGVLLEPLLQRLATLGLRDTHITQLARGVACEPDQRDYAAFDATFSLDGRRHRVRVLLAASVVEAIETLHALCPGRSGAAVPRHHGSSLSQNAAPFGDCVLPGRVILGSRRLPVETLRALAPGDVLLRSLPGHLRAVLHAHNSSAAEGPSVTGGPDGRVTDLAQPPSATVAWGSPGLMRIHAQVNIECRKLILTKEPIMTNQLDSIQPDDFLAPDQQSKPIDIGKLELPVQFELDTVALPFSQLCALGPGYVLELPKPVASAQLKLVTHGQTIGFGELVTVGDHLGIRILRMAHGDDPVR
ncbi:type III secretion system cytoplasmic ring protein SctQ (plasmid) [Cupriavidus necator]|nr:type III secretion system cytoplasmic ring protein SctQ [Cupriavidus necator]